MDQNIIDNSTQNIIKRYTIIYKAIFQYSIYFIPFILGIVWAWSMKSSAVILRIQIPKDTKFPSYIESNGDYRPAKLSDEVGPIFNGFGNVKILGGELQATGGILIGNNNLISLGDSNSKKGGIILPNRPYITNLNFTGGLEYFTKSNYDIAQLKRVIDNWVLSIHPTKSDSTGLNTGIDEIFFRTKERNNTTLTNMEQVLKILQEKMFFDQRNQGGGILEASKIPEMAIGKFIKDNNLSCVFGFKITDVFCDININKMIKVLPEMILDDARQDLLRVSQQIKKDDQVDAFCSNLMINILRKPYPTAELDSIMGGTCKKYDNRYERLKVFLSLQNEIETIVGENIIGNDIELSLFKLVSIQQKLFIQHKDKLLDTSLVTNYLRFVNNLINDKTNPIPQFYIDEMYYFNNVYLRNMLIKLTIDTVNPTVNDDVSKLLNSISNINKGNKNIGSVGLDEIVLNSSLKTTTGTTGNTITSIPYFEKNFGEIIATFPELKTTILQVDETTRTARFVGILQSLSTEKAFKIPSIPIVIDFEYIDGEFKVVTIRTPENTNTDSLIQSYMQKNKDATLSTLIFVIQSNIDTDNLDTGICNMLGGIIRNNVLILNCNSDVTTLQFSNEERITFTLRNNIVLSGIGSNRDRQELINSLINNKNINQDRIIGIVNIISDQIQIEIDNKSTEKETNLDPIKISIIEKCKKYLGVTPTSVVKSGNRWLVSFTLKDMEFASVIDINNNYKLSPLVIKVGEKNITINTFSLSLINLQQKRISLFIQDPILFIKQIDENKYNQIIKELKP